MFINDGSTDTSLKIIEGIRKKDNRFEYISFSRNFGKEIAIIAGLDYSRKSDAVIIMDADLQDPPELIPEMIQEWENIDVVAATENGIMITTNPAHNANAVAEYTIGLILCETRNIARADRSLRDGIWREMYPNTRVSIRELKNLTVGIVGFGSVGRVAEKLSVFNCNILICDPYLNESAYDFINFKFVDMPTLLQKSDIVTLHARSKVPIIGESEFKLMKNNAYLINTARSILVDPKALKKAMDENKIMGAAFDVFETEPIIPEFYKKYDNITITNHRGGDTIESYQEAPVFAISNYLNYLNGERIRFWYNKNQLQ